jgi:ABC-2 type transport system permease protein
MRKLTATEFKLIMREPSAIFFVLVLPVVLVVIFGLIPAMRKPDKAFGGLTAMQSFFPPMAVTVALAIMAFSLLPTILATYREKGVLRRLSTTPAHPARLLAAQVAVNGVLAVVVTGLVMAVGRLAFDVPLPKRPLGFLAAVVLGALCLFAIGVVIAALAPTARAASILGSILFFPSMLLAGVYVPREELPHALQQVSGYTPLGATLQTLRDSWSGSTPRPAHLAIMAAYAVVAGLVAAGTFRWE